MSQATRPAALSPVHPVPGEPFPSDAADVQTATDLEQLTEMLGELRGASLPEVLPAGGPRRFVFDPQLLSETGPLAFVGFRGERRPDVPTHIAAAVELIDEQLIAQMADFPDVVSYSCRPLACGNWINLVVLRGLDAVQAWHRHTLHQKASRELSPQYYARVRIHNGDLPQGIWGGLALTSTKHFAFGSDQDYRHQ